MNKKYYMVLDVETANSCQDALVYDVGFAICDRDGKIYQSDSLIVTDIFEDEKELMQSAYYAKKIPKYIEGIAQKKFKMVNFYNARLIITNALKKWKVEAVCAYNANFDCTSLNTTERWLTKSKYRYFLPYNTKVYCIWHMACQLICTQTGYINFCLDNGFISKAGNIKTSAETVFAFMTKNSNYSECHTGFQDVLIETQIFAECFRKHKAFKKNISRWCWRIPQKKAKLIIAKRENLEGVE